MKLDFALKVRSAIVTAEWDTKSGWNNTAKNMAVELAFWGCGNLDKALNTPWLKEGLMERAT